MAEKLKKGIPWFIILALIGLTVGIGFNFSFKAGTSKIEPSEVEADTATTSVTVGNDGPTWTAMYELTESSSSTPTNVALDVTFRGIANDPNDDDLWLIVCATDTAPSTTTDGACPSCGGGLFWASSTASTTTPITVTYTTSEPDVEKNDWWAWICDDVGDDDQLCTAAYSQGVGTSTVAFSPFVVNHQPIFNALSNTGSIDPDGTVTWNTDGSTDDPDSYGVADDIKLHICQSGGWTTTTDTCVGGYWSSSTAVASNPSATHDDDDDVFPDNTYSANAWLVDDHGLEATGTIAVGASSDFTVNNVAPTISVAEIDLRDTDDVDNLELLGAYEASSTPGFEVYAVIDDKNSCQSNEISTTTAYVYRTGIGSNCSTTADSDPNNCYPEISCDIGPCTGAADSDATTSCTFGLWFVAEPTIGTSTWEGEKWWAAVKAQDDNNASTTAEDSDGNELETFLAMNLLDTAIAYGSVAGDATSTEATTTIQATGNIGLDQNIDGVDMQNGGTDIPIGQQHYSSTTGFAWADGVIASTTAQELELNCPKSTSTSSPATSSTFWVIKVPDGQTGGTYTGTTTIAAKPGEPSDW